MQCLQCSSEFESKRSTAKYCSDKCRKQALRGTVSGTNEGISVTDSLSGTDNDLSVPAPCKFLGANIHLDRDHPKSIIYDVSEEGFIRRNRAWMTHAEEYRDTIRKGAIQRKAARIEHVAAVVSRRAAAKYQCEATCAG